MTENDIKTSGLIEDEDEDVTFEPKKKASDSYNIEPIAMEVM